MPRFPRTKNDILVLAARIADGIVNNPTEYPDPPFDPSTLQVATALVLSRASDRQAKEAAAKEALDLENDALEDAADEAKHLLRLAEDAHGDDAAALQLIGWDVKADPRSLPPGQVRDLDVRAQGPAAAYLDWKAPLPSASTGDVRYYRVERQIVDIQTREVTEEWGVWRQTAIDSKIILADQPRAVEIGYRVIAVNPNGQGEPSDTETIVL